MKRKPPKWADRFLRWYCNPSLLEEIQGDVYELYDRTCAEGKVSSANRKFTWDVIRFFRWSNIKKSNTQQFKTNNTAMVSNYIKTGIRNVLKDKVTSGINIIGLALAIGCAITTYIFVDYYLNQDDIHPNRDRIYQVINKVKNNDAVELWSDIPLLMGPEMKEQVPFVTKMARIEFGSGFVRHEDLVFSEGIIFADTDMLDIFSFSLASGSKKLFEDKNQVFISHKVALKFFGYEEALGKQMSIKFKNGTILSFFVGGVFDEYPSNVSFQPDVLLNIESFFELNNSIDYGWDYLTDGLFLQTSEPIPVNSFDQYYEPWINKQNQSDPEFVTSGFEAIEFTKLPFVRDEISSSLVGNSNPAAPFALSVISLLLILLACSNYVNIAVSSSTKRLKEIALRKTLGGSKMSVVRQFLVENMITCSLAVVIGVFFAYFFFLPGFNSIIPIGIPFKFSSFLQVSMFFLGLLLFIGLVSGAYPAFYISRFNPINIFRGSQKFGSKGFLSKSLLTLQFVIAFSTIVGSFVFTDASMYFAHRDWGYSPDNVISIPLANNEQYQSIYNDLSNRSEIELVSGSKGHIMRYDRVTTVQVDGVNIRSAYYATQGDYDDLIGLRVRKGRFIESENDQQSVVVNERMVKQLGWSNPLDKSLTIDSVRYDVVGVIENFVSDDPYGEALPAVFVAGSIDDNNYIIYRAEDGNLNQAFEAGMQAWHKVAPDDPFQGKRQISLLDYFYAENQSNITLMLFISFMALVLSCIGLYGLVSFNINRRMKEFSVRKVLGANLTNIGKLINGDYIWIILVAFVIGAPVGYLLIIQLLNSIYPDSPQIGSAPYVWALGIILFSLFLTVMTQLVKVAKNNPADRLRNE